MARHFDDAISEGDLFDVGPDDDDEPRLTLAPKCIECGTLIYLNTHAKGCSFRDHDNEEEDDDEEIAD